jgi:hypothetical protein
MQYHTMQSVLQQSHIHQVAYVAITPTIRATDLEQKHNSYQNQDVPLSSCSITDKPEPTPHLLLF